VPPEPATKRTVVFIDGQNLFHAAREAFGYTYPNYDARALAERVCAGQNWQLAQTRFYTGIPDREDDPRWHDFWSAKLAVMGRQGVHVYSRSLRYRNKTVRLPDGTEHTFLTGEEKGIDVRIALDVIRMAHRQEYGRRPGLQPGPGPLRGCRRDPGHRRGAGAVDQDGVRVSLEPDQPEPSRRQQDGLDPDRARELRRVP
jgi:NYN domain